MGEYIGPDFIIPNQYDLLFCEKCGMTYGNCEHHPMFVPRLLISKKDLKKIMKLEKDKWTNIDKLIHIPPIPKTTERSK